MEGWYEKQIPQEFSVGRGRVGKNIVWGDVCAQI